MVFNCGMQANRPASTHNCLPATAPPPPTILPGMAHIWILCPAVSSVALAGTKAVLNHFCLWLQDGNEVCRLEHQTPGYTFLHDFALTPTHYVIVQNPVKLDPGPFLLGKVSAAASVKWIDNKAAEVHLLRRPVVEPNAASQQHQTLQQQQQQSAAHSSNGSTFDHDGHAACVSTSGSGVTVTVTSNTSDGATDKDGASETSGLPSKRLQEQPKLGLLGLGSPSQHSQQAASRLFHQSGHRVCEVNAWHCPCILLCRVAERYISAML